MTVPWYMRTDLSQYNQKKLVENNNILSNILDNMSKRPRKKFRKEDKDKIKYKNVSYRLPEDLLKRLGKHVDKNNSACSLVTQILGWALDDMEMQS